jgi:hypothetical protein
LAVAALVATSTFFTGCGGSHANDAKVEVLVGGDNYTKALPELAVGKTAKFKGALALASTQDSLGKIVKLHMAELYKGDKPAISSVDLSKEFITDVVASGKRNSDEEIIVEGKVIDLRPNDYSIVLEGYNK